MSQNVKLNTQSLAPVQNGVSDKPFYAEIALCIQAIWNAICAWISDLAGRLFSSEMPKQFTTIAVSTTIADSSPDAFRLMMRYLYPEEVALSETVSKSWKAQITEKVWEMQCQQEGVELEANYKCKQGQYKEAFKNPEPIRAFGATEWKQYFGDPGVPPRLPVSIYRTFKKLEATHALTLIPATVNGKPLTLDTFAPFAAMRRMPLRMWAVRRAYGDQPLAKSLWVWMHKDCEPESGGKTQEEARNNYRLGKTLWIVVSTVAHFSRWAQLPLKSDNSIMTQEKNPGTGAPVAVLCDTDGLLIQYVQPNHPDVWVANAFPIE